MESLKVQHAQDLQQRSVLAQQVENLSQRVNNHDALMTGDGPSVLATAEPVARPQEWQVQASGSQEAHITRAECAAMITEALTGKVAPALGALHSHFGPQFQVHRQRIDHIESEVQKLKIRTAWVEKDVMFSQIEVAKRTLVLRNFPEWMTVQDRALTVNQAVREMGLSHVEWDLTTTQMDDGQGELKLSQVSILPPMACGGKQPPHSLVLGGGQDAAKPR